MKRMLLSLMLISLLASPAHARPVSERLEAVLKLVNQKMKEADDAYKQKDAKARFLIIACATCVPIPYVAGVGIAELAGWNGPFHKSKDARKNLKNMQKKLASVDRASNLFIGAKLFLNDGDLSLYQVELLQTFFAKVDARDEREKKYFLIKLMQFDEQSDLFYVIHALNFKEYLNQDFLEITINAFKEWYISRYIIASS